MELKYQNDYKEFKHKQWRTWMELTWKQENK